MSAQDNNLSRRDFLRAGATASAATAALMATGNYAHAQGSGTLRVGLVGCGGRGKGAVMDALNAAPGMVLTAVGDLFQFQVDAAFNDFKDLGAKSQLTKEKCFAGWDNYQKVIDSGVDYVILAAPPGLRPIHFDAAIKASKHVFMEKPVATDAAGIRTVLAASAAAQQKGLGVAAGTQRRHETRYVETMKRIKDGAIGQVLGGAVYWCGGGIWFRDKPQNVKMSDLEYQCWNWYHYIWTCGDQIVEQHVHNIDVMCWVMGGHPQSAYAAGGRTQRTDPRTQIWDNITTDFEYPGGVHFISMGRHWGGSDDRVHERIVGAKGEADPGGWIAGPNAWRFQGRNNAPYQQEHADLITSIRAGKPINEGKQVSESTMTAIMGRQSAYSGKMVKWDDALNSQATFTPDLSNPDAPAPMGPIPMPGKTPV